MNFPGLNLSLPFISQTDIDDIIFGIHEEVDFIAASFVSRPENIIELKQLINNNGGKELEIVLISKIENQSGVDNIDHILEISDGIMVARGDMGVEISYAKLPSIQKMLISKARTLGRRVIVATEMLESMIEHSRPTRAETCDVANAVFDGTSAIMLSGETAAGKYPIECVKTMDIIAKEAEKNMTYESRIGKLKFRIKNPPDAVSHATCQAANDLEAKIIVAFTHSGFTARMVSRFRPDQIIIAVTDSQKTFQKLALSWGVYPILSKGNTIFQEHYIAKINEIGKQYHLQIGDIIPAIIGASSSMIIHTYQ